MPMPAGIPGIWKQLYRSSKHKFIFTPNYMIRLYIYHYIPRKALQYLQVSNIALLFQISTNVNHPSPTVAT